MARLLPPTGPAASARPKRVLVIRPDHIGDVLLSAPAIARLRSRLPHAHLSYLVGPWSAEAAQHGPAVDEVRTLGFPAFTRRPKTNLLQPYSLLWRTARELRREQFDAAIVLRPDHWWGALLARAAGIPIRVGADTPETAPLLTHRRRRQGDASHEHAAREALGLVDLAVRAMGGSADSRDACDGEVTAFRVTEAAHAMAEATWAQLGLGGRRVVVVQPAAGAALKSWPVERWARVVRELVRLGVDVLLMGGPGDGALVEAVRQAAVGDAGGAMHGSAARAVGTARTDQSVLRAGADHASSRSGDASETRCPPASAESAAEADAEAGRRARHDNGPHGVVEENDVADAGERARLGETAGVASGKPGGHVAVGQSAESAAAEAEAGDQAPQDDAPHGMVERNDVADAGERARLGETAGVASGNARVHMAVGQWLAVSAALYARAALLIGPDGGPAHLAAAVGTPTVRLYGPAAVGRFGPWPPRADQVVLVDATLACVPCGVLDRPPCGARTEPACLLALGTADVLDAVRRVLSLH